MSADRYSICPKCHEAHIQKLADLDKQIREAYGVLPFDEYEKLKELRELTEELDPKTTLREDWEIYIDSGITPDATLNVSYEARCSECGFGFKLKEAHDMFKGTKKL